MNIQKNALIGLILFLMVSISGILFAGQPIQAHAEGQLPANTMFEQTEDPLDAGLPTATTDDISQWTERKGFEVIGLLQKFVQPFAIVIFIGCAILTLFGAFGNGKLVSQGLVGMFISLIMYVVVLYAPVIMDVFLNFVRT